MSKIIFCGFGELGTKCLKKIISLGYKVDYIMTHPQNDVNSVDTYAKNLSIDYTYVNPRKSLKEVVKIFSEINPDIIVSVNYRYIIPKEVFKLGKFAINIHGSLLPKYRGRTPHVWSIINGEKNSGITCHIIDEGVDTGDIVSQRLIPIEEIDTGYTLLKKFENNYPDILSESLDKLNRGIKFEKQDENLASYYGKRTPDMGYIDFRKEAFEIINFVRAQAKPYPGAYYYLLDGRKIIVNKIAETSMKNFNFDVGVIKNIDGEYFVKCRNCILKIIEYNLDDF